MESRIIRLNRSIGSEPFMNIGFDESSDKIEIANGPPPPILAGKSTLITSLSKHNYCLLEVSLTYFSETKFRKRTLNVTKPLCHWRD